MPYGYFRQRVNPIERYYKDQLLRIIEHKDLLEKLNQVVDDWTQGWRDKIREQKRNNQPIEYPKPILNGDG